MANILLDSRYYRFWFNHVKLSDSTKRQQASKLRAFGEYIERTGGDTELDFEHFYFDSVGNTAPIDEVFFDEYFSYLVDSGKSNSTLYTTISCLKNFMQFIADNNLINCNCIRYFKNPYYNLRRQDKALTAEESNQLLIAARNKGLKYYTLILLLLRCGLRVNELICLTFPDVYLESSLIYVDKGQKTSADTVMIHPQLASALMQYFKCAEWLDWKSRGATHLFFETNKPLTRDSLVKILVELSSAANIRQVNPHDLRHTMPNLMHQEGASIQTIQRQMRHVRLETTLHYMAPSFLELFYENRLVG